jgi:hypothetical protein
LPINIFFFSAETGRTFGHHFLKRISFAIIPAAFVVGVITTLLAALTVVSIKSLGTGVRYNCYSTLSIVSYIVFIPQLVLLILAIGQMIARTLPHAHVAGPAAYSAPLPLVYNHRDW